jgi:ATP/maltotriose-dependent transcriptional regulator MalT
MRSLRDMANPYQHTLEVSIVRIDTCKGYRSKEIADALPLSAQTIQTHLRNLYEKLHVRSRVEAVARSLGR